MPPSPGFEESICAWRNLTTPNTFNKWWVSLCVAWGTNNQPIGRLTMESSVKHRILTVAGAILLAGASLALGSIDPGPLPVKDITLAECFVKARQISETLGISAENTRLLQEQYRSQLGSVLPHVDWIKSQFYQ